MKANRRLTSYLTHTIMKELVVATVHTIIQELLVANSTHHLEREIRNNKQANNQSIK